MKESSVVEIVGGSEAPKAQVRRNRRHGGGAVFSLQHRQMTQPHQNEPRSKKRVSFWGRAQLG